MGLITSWLAHNVALCVPSSAKVTYNGSPVTIRTPKDVCNSLGGTGPVATDVVVHDGVEVMRVAVVARADDAPVADTSGLSYAFVNSTWCREGSHAKMIFSALGSIVEEKANSGSVLPRNSPRRNALTEANPHPLGRAAACATAAAADRPNR